MVSLIEDLRNHFGEAIGSIRAETAHQFVIALNSPDVRAIAGHLQTHWASRVAAVFAEDRTAAEGLFYNHYVFEQAGNPCYVILEAPVPARAPRWPRRPPRHVAAAGRRIARPRRGFSPPPRYSSKPPPRAP